LQFFRVKKQRLDVRQNLGQRLLERASVPIDGLSGFFQTTRLAFIQSASIAQLVNKKMFSELSEKRTVKGASFSWSHFSSC
jgi:hypothetical protein